MVERTQIQPAPDKSKLVAQDGLMTLQWLAWLNGVTNWMQRVRVYVYTVDVPNITTLSGWWGEFSTPGAVAGDFAIAAIDPAHLDIAVAAQVTAADTTTVWLRNWGAGDVDLGAGFMRIRIERAR